MSDKKTVVVYSTRNGSTEQYAQWIAKDCNADLLRAGETDIQAMEPYDTVIYGGCVYQGSIRGADFIRKNRDKLRGKRLVVFAVGLTHPADDASFQIVVNRNFKPEQQEGIQFFHFPGALDYAKLTFGQKYLMKLLVKNIRKRPAEEWGEMEAALVKSYGTGVDFTGYAYIKPLTDFVNKV